MSLARNPNMPYAVAGRQTQPFERMHVHSNVRVPAAEASVDYDGRMSYSAPNSVRRRREYAGVPMRAAAALVVIAVFILSIFYLSAVSNRSAVYKNRQQIVNDAEPAKGNYGIAGGGGAGARFIHHLLSGGAAAGHGIQPGRKAD